MRTTPSRPNTWRSLVTVREHREFKIHEMLCVALDQAFKESQKPYKVELPEFLTRRLCAR